MRAAVLAVMAVGAAGCSGMVRLSVGPTVDSMGRIGGEVRLTTGIGAGSVMMPIELHGGVGRAGDGDRGVIGGGAALELAGCGDHHLCGQLGLGFIGRNLLGAPEPHIDGFGLSGRVAMQYAVVHHHSGPDWLLRLTTDRVLALGAEVDLTGFPGEPNRGGVFFFGLSGLAASFVH